jgi:hypothetical protein
MSRARAVGVSFLFAALGTVAVPAQAVTISFNDLTDMMTIAVDGVVVTKPPVNETKTNSLTITLNNVLAANAPGSVNDFFALTDPATSDDTKGTLSDILQLSTVKGSKNYTISFTSDQEAALAVPPRAPFGTTDEINGLPLLSIQDPVNGVQPQNSFPFPIDQPHPAGLIIEMASDAQTPVPGALSLFLTGLGAMGLLGWRRKRKAGRNNRKGITGASRHIEE